MSPIEETEGAWACKPWVHHRPGLQYLPLHRKFAATWASNGGARRQLGVKTTGSHEGADIWPYEQILIRGFLHSFRVACDKNIIYKDATIWWFPNFVKTFTASAIPAYLLPKWKIVASFRRGRSIGNKFSWGDLSTIREVNHRRCNCKDGQRICSLCEATEHVVI